MSLQPHRPSLFGPLVWWELVRLARRGRVTRLRVLLLYALLLTLVGFVVVWAYPTSPARLVLASPESLHVGTATGFASSLVLVLLEVQLLLVAVITPAYAVAAVAEEKDRQTLALVLTTDLTDHEIVWGKAIARVLFVAAAVVAGVPVVLLTQFFGPFDPQLLAAGYALALGTTVLSTSIGVHAACQSPDSRTALSRAYGLSAVLVGALLVPPFVFFSPFAMLVYYRMDFGSEALRVAFGFGYPVGQVAIAWMLLIGATRTLRRAGPTTGRATPTAFPEPPRGRPAPVMLSPHVEPPALPPVDDGDPVLWKERHVGRPNPASVFDTPTRWLGALAAVVAVSLFVTAGWLLLKRALRTLDPDELPRLTIVAPGPPDRAGVALVGAGVIASALCLVPLAAGVAGCIAGERQRATLDSLLATTLGRRRLLWSKARAHVERGRVFAVGALVALGAGFAIDGGWRMGLAATAAFVGGLVLVVGYGAWLSVCCQTPARAFRLCLPAVVLPVAAPAGVWAFMDWTDTASAGRTLAWITAVLVFAGTLFFWRAGARLERGFDHSSAA